MKFAIPRRVKNDKLLALGDVVPTKSRTCSIDLSPPKQKSILDLDTTLWEASEEK